MRIEVGEGRYRELQQTQMQATHPSTRDGGSALVYDVEAFLWLGHFASIAASERPAVP
jgi:hypothetical protein